MFEVVQELLVLSLDDNHLRSHTPLVPQVQFGLLIHQEYGQLVVVTVAGPMQWRTTVRVLDVEEFRM